MYFSASSRAINILVVEDEAIVAADIESCLTGAGYQVLGIADNGLDALALATAQRPDVALVDIRLHGDMDGIDLARHLHDELDVPVVFATAHADLPTVDRASTTAPYGYVVKPFDMQSLQVAIEVARARHTAEEKSRKLERWLATTLQSMGDAIIATDRTGNISLMNPKAEALTGWSQHDAAGRPLSEVFALELPKEPQLASRVLGQVMTDGVVFHLRDDAWLRTKTGGALPIDDSIAPIRDERGMITGLVAVFRDRTKLLAAERERRLLEEKMHEAQRLESLGVLAGGIAHDFNNLLTVIFGNASLCRANLPADSKLQCYLESVEQASQRGAELCAQMLAYAGRGQFSIKPVDLSSLVRDTVRLLQISANGAELVFELTEGLPPVEGDASKLQQVVMNLVINAAEALIDERGTITLRTYLVELDVDAAARLEPHRTAMPGSFVVLEVKDTGQGMSEEAKKRVFEPFFTTKFQGRGLGLAALRGILGSHGGGVLVESQLGAGTDFKVFLPASPAGHVTPQRQAPPVSQLQEGGIALIADDEDSVRALACALVRELGFEVDSFCDGDAAVAAVQRDPGRYRIALLDVTMPKLGGAAAARRIHELAPCLPVILMSGYNEDPARIASVRNDEVSVFLPKPFSLKSLREKFVELLTRPTKAAVRSRL